MGSQRVRRDSAHKMGNRMCNLRRKIYKNLWMQGSKVASRIIGGNQTSWRELLLGSVKEGVAHSSAPLSWSQDELERSPVSPLH